MYKLYPFTKKWFVGNRYGSNEMKIYNWMDNLKPI